MPPDLSAARAALAAGKRIDARAELLKIVQAKQADIATWLLFAEVVDTPKQRDDCLMMAEKLGWVRPVAAPVPEPTQAPIAQPSIPAPPVAPPSAPTRSATEQAKLVQLLSELEESLRNEEPQIAKLRQTLEQPMRAKQRTKLQVEYDERARGVADAYVQINKLRAALSLPPLVPGQASAPVAAPAQRGPMLATYILLTVVLVGGFLVFLSLVRESAEPTPIHRTLVRYSVEGSAPASFATYNTPQQGIEQQDSDARWFVDQEFMSGSPLSFAVQNRSDGGEVRCVIIINGKRYREATSTATGGVASCVGVAP